MKDNNAVYGTGRRRCDLNKRFGPAHCSGSCYLDSSHSIGRMGFSLAAAAHSCSNNWCWAQLNLMLTAFWYSYRLRSKHFDLFAGATADFPFRTFHEALHPSKLVWMAIPMLLF